VSSFLLVAALALGHGLNGVTAAQAQTGTIRVDVAAGEKPIAGATVVGGGSFTTTDASGTATLSVRPGLVDVTVTNGGYEPATVRVEVVAGSERAVRVTLTVTPASLSRDRLDENLQRTPGNIVSSLDGMSGLRAQTTSPELGTAMIRIHGLRGHYTRLLADSVPIYFDLPGGLAFTQIPLMDLAAIDVFKGSASGVFGTNALAGVVNLISRRPVAAGNREFVFSQSMQGATDGVLWSASPATGSRWSRTFLAGVHHQNENDVDDDGWSDLPGYSRLVARQRTFWDNGQGKSASGTAGLTFEKRDGGSEIARQSLETKGVDGALFGQMPLGRYVLAGAATLFFQQRTRDFSEVREYEKRESATMNIELRGMARRHRWVAGIVTDWFTVRSALESAYLSTRPGIFARDDMQVAPWLSLSGSLRVDHHNIHGFFVSPYGSLRAQRGQWTAGIAGGTSYFAPTALMEETEAAGLTHLSIARPLDAETARSVAAHVAHQTAASAVTFTFFQSRINHPAQIDRSTYTLRTEADPVETRGIEIAGDARRGLFAVIGSYTYVHPRHSGQDVALTPRQNARVVATVDEPEGRGRIGVQVSFTGAQRLDANPYRTTGESYTVLGLLGEYPFGRVRVFVNADNLTNVRQTDWDPIARPARDVDGRWTVDAWAPLAGRTINIGLRVSF